MTIKYLKELIKDLPDDMRVCADDGNHGMFEGNSEFLTLVYTPKRDKCVLQTKNDFDLENELEAMLKFASENNIDEQDFWTTFSETGYKYTDFEDEEEQNWAKAQLENYGLI